MCLLHISFHVWKVITSFFCFYDNLLRKEAASLFWGFKIQLVFFPPKKKKKIKRSCECFEHCEVELSLFSNQGLLWSCIQKDLIWCLFFVKLSLGDKRRCWIGSPWLYLAVISSALKSKVNFISFFLTLIFLGLKSFTLLFCYFRLPSICRRYEFKYTLAVWLVSISKISNWLRPCLIGHKKKKKAKTCGSVVLH